MIAAVRGEMGSMLPMVGGLVLATLVVLLLALDVSIHAAVVREAAFAADVGAETGAAQIDAASRYAGRLAIDEDAAAAAATVAARAARPRPGREVDVTTTPDRVCVTVRQAYRAHLVQITARATARACAVPAEG